MIIVLLGASGSGKSTIENELATHYGFEKIVSYTTRPPRVGEEDGMDYYFTGHNDFSSMINTGVLAEYDEYSKGRLYGTLKSDYTEGNKVVILTPNGLRSLRQNCPNYNIVTVLVNANLGTRIKRYIDRCGVDRFTYDDKNEISARVERDFAMFLGLEKEVDLVVENNEGTNIVNLIDSILDTFEDTVEDKIDRI